MNFLSFFSKPENTVNDGWVGSILQLEYVLGARSTKYLQAYVYTMPN